MKRIVLAVVAPASPSSALSLSAMVAVAAVISVNVPAVAAEPSKGQLKQDPQTVQDLEQGRKPSGFVRDEPANLRVEDMTMDELKKRLAEYAAGQRDDRDGVILADQLCFNFRGRKETGSPEAQHACQLRADLLKKYPDFNSLSDNRLSDKIRYEAQRQEDQAQVANEAKKWVPKDFVPRKIYISGSKLAAVYQFKIAFYQLPVDVRAEVKNEETVVLTRGAASVDLSALQPKKVLTFKRSFSVPVERGPDGYSNLLICTSSLASGYTPMSREEESEMGRLKVSGRGVENGSGSLGAFCGVISLSGDVVYQFQVAESPPKRVLAPVGITADGRKAAVMVGEKITGSDGVGFYVGRPREVLVWTAAGGVRKMSLDYPKTSDEQVKRDFFNGKL